MAWIRSPSRSQTSCPVTKVGRDRHEGPVQILDPDPGEVLFHGLDQVPAADHARGPDPEIEIRHDPHLVQGARPIFQIVGVAGQISATDHGADRGAGDDVGPESVALQRAQHPQMSPTARDPAAERKAELRTPGRWRKPGSWPILAMDHVNKSVTRLGGLAKSLDRRTSKSFVFAHGFFV